MSVLCNSQQLSTGIPPQKEAEEFRTEGIPSIP